eukprot:m.143142 g.143142  ORF g.143142 m.143142 type:complete len:67 (+) comp22964_c0_seq1:258-458(+)
MNIHALPVTDLVSSRVFDCTHPHHTITITTAASSTRECRKSQATTTSSSLRMVKDLATLWHSSPTH